MKLIPWNISGYFKTSDTLVATTQYSHIAYERCDDSRGLFEVQCLPNDNNMIITINKACHQKRFRGKL